MPYPLLTLNSLLTEGRVAASGSDYTGQDRCVCVCVCVSTYEGCTLRMYRYIHVPVHRSTCIRNAPSSVIKTLTSTAGDLSFMHMKKTSIVSRSEMHHAIGCPKVLELNSGF